MKDMRPICFLCYGVLYKNTGLDDHHSLKLDLVSKNILNYFSYWRYGILEFAQIKTNKLLNDSYFKSFFIKFDHLECLREALPIDDL